MSSIPFLPPTRPLLIWAALALVCAVVLSVEGVSLLGGRTRPWPGWQLGVLFLLGSLVAAALSARLYALHGEVQWTEQDLATWLILGTLLGSAVLAFTVYGGVRTSRYLRSPSARDDETRRGSEWPFSGDLFVLALMMDAGIWALVLTLPRLVEAAYYAKNYMPAGDGLGILPLYTAIASTVCSVALLIIPLTILLRARARSQRVTL
jgi:hypothetical protein